MTQYKKKMQIPRRARGRSGRMDAPKSLSGGDEALRILWILRPRRSQDDSLKKNLSTNDTKEKLLRRGRRTPEILRRAPDDKAGARDLVFERLTNQLRMTKAKSENRDPSTRASRAGKKRAGTFPRSG
jgi:hypothetical protein